MDTHFTEIAGFTQVRVRHCALGCKSNQKAQGEMTLAEATAQKKDSS